MATGVWTAVSGATAQSQAVESVANNLANMDTLGFKKDLPTFKEYLSVLEREHSPQEVPRGAIKDKDFYPLDGRDQSFVMVDGTYTHFKQGNLRVTQVPLDVALDGPGFLEVSTPSGVRYTRHGGLKMATDGRLVTTEGYPVLAAQPGGLATALPASAVQPNQGGLAGQAPLLTQASATQGGVAAGQGADVASRFINLKDRSGPITINEQGEISSGDESIAKLALVEFQDLKKLRKQGGFLFENRDVVNISTVPPRTVFKQGMLETSNVNPVEEMTQLIKANRMFEHDLRAIKTYDSLLQHEVMDIGKL